jgi:hypothetical protein
MLLCTACEAIGKSIIARNGTVLLAPLNAVVLLVILDCNAIRIAPATQWVVYARLACFMDATGRVLPSDTVLSVDWLFR